MAGDHCFISYASERQDLAEAVCRGLEQRGLVCWIAPRDVGPGNYGAAITAAIRAARALVFVLTREALASGFVQRELETAAAAGVTIVPLRFDDAPLPDDTAFFVAGMHIFDLRQGNLEQGITRLAEHLARSSAPAGATVAAAVPSPGRERRFASRWHGFLDGVMQGFMGLSPLFLAFALVFLGLFMLGLAFLVGVGQVAYRLPAELGGGLKEVGYLWAVNWSLGFLLLYPVLAAVGIQALREMRDVAQNLVRRRMVVDESFRLADPGRVEYELQRTLRRATAVAVGLFAFSLAYSLWEFFTVVGVHYFSGAPFADTIGLDDPFQERDWSVAALLPTLLGPPIDPWANFAFALAAYVLLVGGGTALVLSIFVLLLAVTGFAYGLSGRSGLRFVPDLRGRSARGNLDPRCGFQVFEGVFRKGLLVVLLAFVGLFLAHLQNLYMRSTAESLPRFVAPAAEGDAWAGLGGFFGSLTTEEGIANLSSAIAFGLATCLFSSVIVLLSISLRQGAQRAQQLLLERLADEEQPLPEWLRDLGREEATARLEAMRFWPVRWPRVNQMLLAMGVAFLSLVFYRVGVLLIALGLAFALWRAVEPGGDRPARGGTPP